MIQPWIDSPDLLEHGTEQSPKLRVPLRILQIQPYDAAHISNYRSARGVQPVGSVRGHDVEELAHGLDLALRRADALP